MNCLCGGHFVTQCKSSHRCKACQRPHHTLLHVEPCNDATSGLSASASTTASHAPPQVTSHTDVNLRSSALLMTCCVLVLAPDGSSMEARALLDNGSSVSFVSERLIQSLGLSHVHRNVRISGIAGSSPRSPLQSIASFQISAVHCNGKKINLTAIVIPKVTCDLPVNPVPFELTWKHLSNIPLDDPAFGQPGRIDLLLGADVFVDVLLHGRRTGPPGSPVALRTKFGGSSVAARNREVPSTS